MRRLEECEIVAHGAAAEVKRAHARLDAQPPQGERGGTGERGEHGAPGLAGRDGKDGAPGRDAVGIQGPQGRAGDAGRDGKDAPQRVELDNLLIEHSRAWKALRAEIAAVQAQVQALVDMNKNASAYLEFLRSKREARKGQQ